MADTPDILRVCGVPDSPVVHLDTGILVLRLPDRVHQDVDCALRWLLGMPIQNRHSEHDSPARLARIFIFLQHGPLALQLGLSVEIGWLGRAVRLVRRVPLGAREHVVCGYIDEEYVPRGAELCERGRRGDVQGSSAFGVAVAFIWEPVCSTFTAALAVALI